MIDASCDVYLSLEISSKQEQYLPVNVVLPIYTA